MFLIINSILVILIRWNLSLVVHSTKVLCYNTSMKSPILFFDSGIGGLPYYKYFRTCNPAETIVYFADRQNFPYGAKDHKTLSDLICSLMKDIRNKFKPKLVVIACNSASISALYALRSAFADLPFVGTVPALKPAIGESRTRHIGVIGTERTIKDPYITYLACRYGSDCTITGIAAPSLVEFVEYCIMGATQAEKRQAVLPIMEQFRNSNVDSVVLGCTHFLFLQEEFVQTGAPDIRIYDSISGVSHRAESIMDSICGRCTSKTQRDILVVSGKTPIEESWRVYAESFDLELMSWQDVL